MSKEKIKDGTAAQVHAYSIVIDGISYPNNFSEDIRLDRTILEEEFADQSAKYAYYSTLAALAKDQEAKLKVKMERVYAQEDSNARKDAIKIMQEDPSRKFTEKMHETVTKTSRNYQLAQNAYLEAKKLADLCKSNADAFAQRKEMLISLGAHARIGGTDVRVLGNHVRNSQRKEPEIEEEIVETKSRRKPKQQ